MPATEPIIIVKDGTSSDYDDDLCIIEEEEHVTILDSNPDEFFEDIDRLGDYLKAK